MVLKLGSAIRLSIAISLYSIAMIGIARLVVESNSGGVIPVEEIAIGPAKVEAGKIKKQRLFPCHDFSQVPFLGQRGSFWVLYNYVQPTIRFACDESVTYTTHADHTYLDNLVPLLERWLGPVSLSLYTPGTDFYDALLRIHYLRECSHLVRDFVSFHLFFGNSQIPQNLSNTSDEAFSRLPTVNCSMGPSFGPNVRTFRKSRRFSYPVNVGRNVAREMASTHYVLASDIELYPSSSLIPSFVEMIQRDGSKLLMSPNPKVFVLPIFEVEANVSAVPHDKTELQKTLSNRIAQPFQEKICPHCFRYPKQEEWLRANATQGLHVFTVGKRKNRQFHWEPIYIGTKSDPMYDERLTWEGRDDKIVQGYILCLLDYEFHVLDNAFLVHRPGIKKRRRYTKTAAIRRQHVMIKRTIQPELTLLYGRRPGCLISK